MDLKIDFMKEKNLSPIMKIEEESFPCPWSRHSFLRDINDNPYSLYLIAKVEDKLVGYIGGWIIIDELHITTLAVESNYRHQGIATKLIKEILKIVRGKEVISVTLEVRKSNQAAFSLYKKLGFTKVGQRPNYYSNNREDALIMRKEINNGQE